MRKIIVLNRITLDGVLQAPTRPAREEDPSDNFPFGGWTVPYSDDVLSKSFREQMSKPFDLLLGRKTFDVFASIGHIMKIYGLASMKHISMWLQKPLQSMNGGTRSFLRVTFPMK